MNAVDERCRAYQTVARAIRFVRQNSPAQPGLQEIAAQLGISPYHLQRTFSVWAGISPKRFLQYLTSEHARSLLRERHDVLTAAYAAGLSGPGRLHDLMVACDAVTPGEVRSLGDGLLITYGFATTLFGRVIAGSTARGLCHLQFTDAGPDSDAVVQLQTEWPHARLIRDDDALAASIARTFSLVDQGQPMHLLLRGTNFQVKVWKALLALAPGEVVSYGALATLIDQPRAQRAVGSALARNRIALLIPCHRVIRENGDVGSYRWGRERKQALLVVEAALRSRRESPRS
ncbi:MAG: methylated-DNA--[protein]-cysteine S-methyltransferase [Candidatus Accumulibacter sp.]|uniref:methylated-DNA--[protein]-cysteine S-methyltransferase n=1 Tax=Accumulibacter sp. TaxID=2053492 RepID=UPI001DE96E65|nr:methylated-DNA--[protein]-cysteine S-methyltransferase [Accumulibacter sp.]MCB1943809.1 methylated-DNA--[protein]-cysteine S-methyltransferase [Accumulibacter sp.]MCP5248728.1 methylated-DNA--[protein]-cysteine S-methyltransferase [Accumulibacter sp.]